MRANDLPKSALFARAFHIFFSAAGFRRVHCKIQSVVNTRKQLNMLDFKPITKELLIREGRSLRRSRIQICDYTPGCLYIWRHYYHMRCAEADGMFIFESGDGSGLYYNCPVGTGDFSAAVLEARDDAEKRGIPLRFSCIPSEYVDVIQSIIGRKAEIVSDRASADYLYPYEQFCGYNGKALHGQRNHVNRFKAEHPDFSFEMLTGENLPEAESFMRLNRDEFYKGSEISADELARIDEFLPCISELGISGGMLRAGGVVVGLTAGEIVGDTLHVHIEKALRDFSGAYQTLAMCFAESMKLPGVNFINRQDDTGDEGLRKSKLSYKPCALLDKFTLLFG